MKYPVARPGGIQPSPPLTGGDKGEGEIKLKSPPPLPSPIKGEGFSGNPVARLQGILILFIISWQEPFPVLLDDSEGVLNPHPHHHYRN
jgi:hypothetical protein